MNVALLLPAGLAALATLLLPLLIHLARRSEHRTTAFAALRWLRVKPRPRRRIRFDEWPLLLARLLLLALLALLLARPVVHGAHDGAPRVVVAPEVEVARVRASIAPAGARWHRLEPGFPAFDAASSPADAPATRASITSLLREFDAALPPGVALTVLVPPVLDGVDAQRPALSRRVDWQVLPAERGGGVRDAAGAASRTVGGSGVGTAQAAPGSDAPGAEDAAHAPGEPAPSRVGHSAPRAAIRFAADRTPALRYLRAALAAWTADEGKPGAGGVRGDHDIAPLDAPLPPSTQPLVWLVPGPAPARVCEWIHAGGTALLDAQTMPCSKGPSVPIWRDASGVPVVEAASHGRGRMLRFTRLLDPQSMPELLDSAFPARLRALFEAAPPPPTRVRAADHAPSAGGASYPQPPRELAPWLVVLIALVFLVERTMATSRRRGGGP